MTGRRLAVLLACGVASGAQAATARGLAAGSSGVAVAGGRVLSAARGESGSDLPNPASRRCGTIFLRPAGGFRDAADCSDTSTNPLPLYDPPPIYVIPVVVHVIQASNGDGNVSDALVASQIEVLNEDYAAMPGTPGAAGTPVAIRYFLATTDPNGQPSTGITRTTNDTWFNDDGDYWTPLHWDTTRYLNIYTNSAGGFLGYSFLPNDGTTAGDPFFDRVVILWSAFGRPASGGPPYDQGRTTTHEVGHFLGLFHTFAPENGSCAPGSPPDCYTSGDLVCDTASEAVPHFGCTISDSCPAEPGNDPIHDYMDFTDDTCLTNFTLEQSRRLRCTLTSFRPTLARIGIFFDGFESGDTSLWSSTAP